MAEEALGGGPLLAVGTIIRPHGVRGAVIVAVESDWTARFDPGTRLLLEKPSGELGETEVESSRPHRGDMLVRLSGVPDRNAAEALKGSLLLVPESEAAPLGEGEYWAHDLVAMRVVDEDGRPLGEVGEVICGEAQDALVVKRRDGTQFRLPFVVEFIKRVDPAGREITVRVIEGMLD